MKSEKLDAENENTEKQFSVKFSVRASQVRPQVCRPPIIDLGLGFGPEAAAADSISTAA